MPCRKPYSEFGHEFAINESEFEPSMASMEQVSIAVLKYFLRIPLFIEFSWWRFLSKLTYIQYQIENLGTEELQ